MKFNGVSMIGKQCRMDHARQYRWAKTKNATKKKAKKKEEIFSRTTTFYLGIASFVAITIVSLFPAQLKSLAYAQQGKTVIEHKYNILLDPLVSVESVDKAQAEEYPQAEILADSETNKGGYSDELDLPEIIDGKTQYILTKINAPQILKVWRKETNRGTNKNPHALHNYCKSQGLSNELGYGGMQLKLCFSDFEAAVDRVDRWFTENNYSENQQLCKYNTGKASNSCDYLNL